MDFSVYAQPRRYRSPYRGRTERVGVGAVLWTLVTGPFYLWKKGAMIEALLLFIAGALPFLPIEGDGAALDGIASLAWLGGGLLAPVVLAMSYERRGWTDVTDRPYLDALDEDDWSRDRLDRE